MTDDNITFSPRNFEPAPPPEVTHERFKEIVEVLHALVVAHNYEYLDRGIGIAFPHNQAWLKARAILKEIDR